MLFMDEDTEIGTKIEFSQVFGNFKFMLDELNVVLELGQFSVHVNDGNQNQELFRIGKKDIFRTEIVYEGFLKRPREKVTK